MKHVLEHDFEAALYILVWLALRNKAGRPPGETDLLWSWRCGPLGQMSNDKLAFLHSSGLWVSITFSVVVKDDYKVLLQLISRLSIIVMNWNNQRASRERAMLLERELASSFYWGTLRQNQLIIICTNLARVSGGKTSWGSLPDAHLHINA